MAKSVPSPLGHLATSRFGDFASRAAHEHRLCRSRQHGRGDRQAHAANKQPLRVYDLSPERVSEIGKLGGQPTQSLAALAAQSDIVCLCLPTSENVRDRDLRRERPRQGPEARRARRRHDDRRSAADQGHGGGAGQAGHRPDRRAGVGRTGRRGGRHAGHHGGRARRRCSTRSSRCSRRCQPERLPHGRGRCRADHEARQQHAARRVQGADLRGDGVGREERPRAEARGRGAEEERRAATARRSERCRRRSTASSRPRSRSA